MIEIRLINHDYYNEIADIVRMYFGKCEIARSERALADSQSFLPDNTVLITSSLEIADKSFICTSKYKEQQKQETVVMESSIGLTDEKALKHLVKKSMYKLLNVVFERGYPWGMLTGIRPVKLVHELMNKMVSVPDIPDMLVKEYLISEDRAQLAVEIASIERPFVYPYNDKEISIYIGIPFCPSRCNYCSFTSNSISTCHEYVEPYLENLMKEIRKVSEYLNNKGFHVQTIYIGGGTPTAISAKQLEKLMNCINQSIGRQAAEFTCEAGRPDSITQEKLQVLYENNVSRISINPQTMNDATLKCIGRAHNTQQVVESFRLARNTGFDNINMDLILGLPGETMVQLVHTLDEIKKLGPESVTVHTLALKRASVYNERLMTDTLFNDENVSQMMEYTKGFLRDMGMHPYYLYRQKHMLQNLENIGFSQKGFECIYNMQIIEEKQTIVAFGADAVTKIVINSENRIERQHNIKDLKLYIENTEAMINKKLNILKQI
ncbi:MAG: coproporphyrinogen dehydrogenase HemZ [Clostridiaceae bacterium]|nr:coproporphyrinogen dehydrogenase HemZ [Clostridiaceae bacterium]